MKALGSHSGGEITRGLEYFLATGNLVTKIGLALQQVGFVVVVYRVVVDVYKVFVVVVVYLVCPLLLLFTSGNWFLRHRRTNQPIEIYLPFPSCP